MEQPIGRADVPPSLDVLFDYVQNYLDVQSDQINTLDNKAAFVLGSASLLTAGIASLQGALPNNSAGGSGSAFSSPESWAVIVLIVLILIPYLILVYAAYQAYKIRAYQSVTKLRDLRNKYIGESPDKTRQVLLDTMITAFENNQVILTEKVKWTERAVRSLLIEAFLVALLIVIQLIFLIL